MNSSSDQDNSIKLYRLSGKNPDLVTEATAEEYRAWGLRDTHVELLSGRLGLRFKVVQ